MQVLDNKLEKEIKKFQMRIPDEIVNDRRKGDKNSCEARWENVKVKWLDSKREGGDPNGFFLRSSHA